MSDLTWIILIIIFSILFITFSILAIREYFEKNQCANTLQSYCFDDWQCEVPDDDTLPTPVLFNGNFNKLSELNDFIKNNCPGPNCCDVLCTNCAFPCGVTGGLSNPCPGSTNQLYGPNSNAQCPVVIS